jgi:hypothetical protein
VSDQTTTIATAAGQRALVPAPVSAIVKRLLPRIGRTTLDFWKRSWQDLRAISARDFRSVSGA